MTQPQSVIDSHIHIWEPTVLSYPWLDSEPDLRRPFLPADLRRGGGAGEWVMVQAEGQGHEPGHDLAELDWIASLAASEPALRGMIVRAQSSLV